MSWELQSRQAGPYAAYLHGPLTAESLRSCCNFGVSTPRMCVVTQLLALADNRVYYIVA
jgi:hypothetical protein